jgi:ferredoxin
MLVIDPDVCIGCYVCTAECEQNAIEMLFTKDEEKWTKYNAENAPILPPCEM